MKHIPIMILSMHFLMFSHSAISGVLDVSINLKEEVILDSKEYYLSDIAEVKSDNNKIASEIRNIFLGQSPKRGLTRNLSKKTISEIIYSNFSNNQLMINWSENGFVRIKSESQTVNMRDYFNESKKTLLDYLNSNIHGETRFEVAPIKDGNFEITVDKGKIRYEAYLKDDAKINKRMCVWLDIYVDADFQKTLPVWFDVKAFKKAYEVSHPMKKHDVIVLKDLELVEHDVASSYPNIVGIEDFKDEMILMIDRKPGQILLSTHIKNKPAVKRNEKVEVHVYGPGVLIKTFDLAVDDAEIGDWVKLRSDNGEHYYAQVFREGGVNVY